MLRWQQDRLAEVLPAMRAAHDEYGDKLPGLTLVLARALVEDDSRRDEARALVTEVAHDDFAQLRLGTFWASTLLVTAETARLLDLPDACRSIRDLLIPFVDQVAFSGLWVAGPIAYGVAVASSGCGTRRTRPSSSNTPPTSRGASTHRCSWPGPRGTRSQPGTEPGRQPATRSAAANISRPTGCRSTCVHSRPVETRSTTPHSQIAGRVEAGPPREQLGSIVRVAGDELGRVFAHQDPEVVLGRREEPVGIDELEARARLERVPLVDVAVDEHRPFVVVRGDAPGRARTRVLDRAFRTRPVERRPGRGDELDEPAALVGSGRQPAVGSRPPQPRRRRRHDLEPLGERPRELVQRPAEPLEEQRATTARRGAATAHILRRARAATP